MSDILEYKCPCCGGSVEFDSTAQKMKCPYCDTEFEIDELKAAQGNPSVAADWQGGDAQLSDEEADGMNIYVCKSCGGEIIGDKTTAATSCPYCGNPVVLKGQFKGELKPDLVIPFKLDKKSAKEALLKHISSKSFVPKIFKDENHIDEIKGIYVPEWLFDCNVSASMKYKGQKTRDWTDAGFRYSETSYYDLVRNGSFTVEGLPVDGSSKMDDTIMEAIEPFDIKDAVDFDTAYLSGYFADRYDVGAEKSRERANERITESAFEAFSDTVDEYEGVSCDESGSQINIENGKCRYALYPVWILNTSWEDKKYTFAMNGQTGKMVGDLPLDKKEFKKWLGILTAALGCAVYAIAWLISSM